MEISIRHIGGRIVNNYLLDTPLGVIAIDTGYSGGMERFRARFEKYWPLSRLTYLFLTHHHDDHAGFWPSSWTSAAARWLRTPWRWSPWRRGGAGSRRAPAIPAGPEPSSDG